MKISASFIIRLIVITLFLVSIIYFSFIKERSILERNTFGMRLQNPGEEALEYIKSQLDICNRQASMECYQQASDVFLSQFEYRNLLRIIESGQTSPEVFSRCHALAHFIGRAAFKDNPSVRELYEQSSPTCWGGFYHGVIESYFETKPYKGDESFAAQIREVCGTREDYSVPFFFWECNHGIGHAMMFVSNGDLIKSLSWCDSLSEREMQKTCYGGVFMENSSSSTLTGSDHVSRFIKAEDPMYPCNILEERYLDICYQYQSSYFAQLVNHDWVKTADLCLQTPAPYQHGCFSIIGSNQVGSTSDPIRMNTACESMPNPNSKTSCLMGVLSGLSGRYINEPEIIKQFCSAVNNDYKKECWTGLGRAIYSWSSNPSSLENLCQGYGELPYKWCLEGLGNPQSYSSFLTN